MTDVAYRSYTEVMRVLRSAFQDEISSKAAGKISLPVAVGLGVIALGIVGAIVLLVVGAFSRPAVTIEEGSAPDVQSADEQTSEGTESLYVHVTGCVVAPGMYELSFGARVQDAIAAAGGLTEEALDTSVNLARELTDGEQIIVASQNSTADANQGESATSGATSTSSGGVVAGKVNINVATAEELETLDGIGPSTSAKIIAYREANGSFASIEAIKEVSGIGDKKYEAIKDSITV